MSGPRSVVARFWGAIPVALLVLLLAVRALLATDPLENLARVDANPRDPQGTVAYAGSLHIARGGPVIIGFQSDTPARLLVGGTDPTQQIAKDLVGKGLVKDRVVLPAGAVAIRFAASPGARLVWSPVGRRGDPEYLPASSLSPAPPESAHFDTWAGARPLDGVIALAILFVIIGACLALVRRRLRTVSRELWIALGSVFVLGCLVRLIGLSDFGQTWDEDVNWAAGRNYVTNLLALDASPGSWVWNYEHPPVMKYLAGIGAQFADGYGPARALSAVWMSLGCALLVPIGTRLFNLRVGVLAGLVATLLPHLIGHGQIVGHESPTVLWWMLGILLALTAGDGEPTDRQRQRRFVAIGAVIGIAVASRFVSGLLGPLVLAIVVIEAPAARRIRTLLEAGILMPVAAVLTFVALWPRLWFTPIASLEQSFAKLSQTHATEPFLGTLTNTPGASYFVAYLVATLPILVLVGVAAFLARAGRERNRAALIVGLWLVLPLAVMASPVRQDGVRYVMPSVVALALMSAAGWEWAATFAQRWIPRAFLAWATVVVLYLGVTAFRVRPYYIDYYGEHVGGPANVAAKGLFETAWWGEGVAEAVDHVNAHAARGARVSRNCVEPAHLAWFREDLWTPMTNQPAQADWIVAYSPATRPCAVPPGFTIDHVVRAQSAVLAIVYKR